MIQVFVLKFSFIYLITSYFNFKAFKCMDEFFFSFGIVCDARLKSSIEIQCIVFHTKEKRLKSCSSVFLKFQVPLISSSFSAVYLCWYCFILL